MHQPIPSRQEFITMLAEPPKWLSLALADLEAAQLDATPFPGKWSCRQAITHIVEADLGWSDILYRAVRPQRPEHGDYDPRWQDDLILRLREGGIHETVAVMTENHAGMAHWIASLSDEDFLKPFPGVLWLAEAGLQVVIADSGRWGLYLHPYHHLAYLQRQRLALGRPAPALDRFLQRCPGQDPTAPWPPWAATS